MAGIATPTALVCCPVGFVSTLWLQRKPSAAKPVTDGVLGIVVPSASLSVGVDGFAGGIAIPMTLVL